MLIFVFSKSKAKAESFYPSEESLKAQTKPFLLKVACLWSATSAEAPLHVFSRWMLLSRP